MAISTRVEMRVSFGSKRIFFLYWALSRLAPHALYLIHFILLYMLVMDYIDPSTLLQGPAGERMVDLFDSNTKYAIINEYYVGLHLKVQ